MHFLLSLALLLPVFVSVRSGGVVFDTNAFYPSDYPALPLGIFVLSMFFWVEITKRINFYMSVLLFVLFTGGVIVLSNLPKGFAYLVTLSFSVLAYSAGRYSCKNLTVEQITKNLFFALLLISMTKLVFDIVQGRILSEFFVLESIRIYNFYGYYPIIYLLFAVTALLLKSKLLSSTAVVFSFFVFFSFSRFYIFAVPMIYCLYFLKFYRLSFFSIFTLMFCFVVFCTFLAVMFGASFADMSLVERVEHWGSFFKSYEALDVIFPFLNDYRQSMNYGSFHNELIDFYSYFGVFFIPIIVIIYKCFESLDKDAVKPFKLLAIIFFLGLLIQNNISHLWSGVLIFYILGSYSEKKYNTEAELRCA